jgi:hypothetical protein
VASVLVIILQRRAFAGEDASFNSLSDLTAPRFEEQAISLKLDGAVHPHFASASVRRCGSCSGWSEPSGAAHRMSRYLGAN